MDAITLLKDDHRTVEQLFKRFEKAGDRAHVEKRRVVDRIIEELSVHAAIEEQVFYPVARATVPGTEDVALESLEEHHIVKWSLSELVDLEPEHERFDAKVTVLIENVRHHVEEEESDFFPKVRERLGRKKLEDLGRALADAKKSAPTRPHPRMSEVGSASAVVGAITGVVDRVGDNLSGIAQGSVTAVQELIAGFLGSDRPSVAPTKKAAKAAARSTATSAKKSTGTTKRTAKRAATKKTTAKRASTKKAAKAAAKSTATSAKKSTGTTKKSAKRAATKKSGAAARSATKKAAGTAKRTASKRAGASSGSR